MLAVLLVGYATTWPWAARPVHGWPTTEIARTRCNFPLTLPIRGRIMSLP
jgi:hypothetical protein